MAHSICLRGMHLATIFCGKTLMGVTSNSIKFFRKPAITMRGVIQE